MSDLKKNVWELDGWYDQTVAGDGSYYADNTFWSWGDNQNGALGQNQSAPVLVSSPTQIPGTTWSKIAQGTGYNYHMAIKSDNTMWVWGVNGYGGLGQNSVDPAQVSSPVQIPGTAWNKVAVSQRHFLAIRTDGTLWACGSNQMGELGLSQAASSPTAQYSRSSPVQIPGTWTDVACGTNRSYGIKTNGELYCWGYNQNGTLGLNEQYSPNKSSPTQIHGGGTNWAKFATSGDNSIQAIKTDGTLWGWGGGGFAYNQPTNSARSSPTQMPGTNWSEVSSSYNSVWATKTDGTLWAWGNNPDGQLGLNNRTQYSSPVQIGTNTNWSKVRSGMNMCFFRTTGNALFAVGDGGNGRLGNNGTAKVSSPVIIGGGAWSDVGGYYNTSFGIREW